MAVPLLLWEEVSSDGVASSRTWLMGDTSQGVDDSSGWGDITGGSRGEVRSCQMPVGTGGATARYGAALPCPVLRARANAEPVPRAVCEAGVANGVLRTDVAMEMEVSRAN